MVVRLRCGVGSIIICYEQQLKKDLGFYFNICEKLFVCVRELYVEYMWLGRLCDVVCRISDE